MPRTAPEYCVSKYDEDDKTYVFDYQSRTLAGAKAWIAQHSLPSAPEPLEMVKPDQWETPSLVWKIERIYFGGPANA